MSSPYTLVVTSLDLKQRRYKSDQLHGAIGCYIGNMLRDRTISAIASDIYRMEGLHPATDLTQEFLRSEVQGSLKAYILDTLDALQGMAGVCDVTTPEIYAMFGQIGLIYAQSMINGEDKG